MLARAPAADVYPCCCLGQLARRATMKKRQAWPICGLHLCFFASLVCSNTLFLSPPIYLSEIEQAIGIKSMLAFCQQFKSKAKLITHEHVTLARSLARSLTRRYYAYIAPPIDDRIVQHIVVVAQFLVFGVGATEAAAFRDAELSLFQLATEQPLPDPVSLHEAMEAVRTGLGVEDPGRFRFCKPTRHAPHRLGRKYKRFAAQSHVKPPTPLPTPTPFLLSASNPNANISIDNRCLAFIQPRMTAPP
ncbi:hypothetical protein VOLCADRAFT_97135 [Volvox carteri f. nagariensis]|uniref:Uncharacterized protein n=1 Tax=Volvox carteri f. nagariensis TaxID=3068 RepID=D8UBZ2_VOLCA|nr:uncharacterized protein VOLCADRAFT_97135 [Volvox carteri f. nagariensis]EFJ42706.1 hypothetical protein VOLCADRAFT_97135 [Volvox carteri f. nagariensis]|eukprot:XP_002956167.1 hypothetical protein VOLCADRAFT_97135 [Volvox carteri f. nagariensis]